MGKNLQHNIIKLAFVRADGIGTFEFDMKKTLVKLVEEYSLPVKEAVHI